MPFTEATQFVQPRADPVFSGKQMLAFAGALIAAPCVVLALSTPTATISAYTAPAPTVASSTAASSYTRPVFASATSGSVRVPAGAAKAQYAAQQAPQYVEVSASSTTPMATKALTAWIVTTSLAGLFALVARATDKASKRANIVELVGTTVDSNNLMAMASTTGEMDATTASKGTALVVTNKGGGHGEIGFHLAMALRAKGLHVQMINDNGGKEILDKKPFSEYGQLLSAGVEVFFTDLSVPGNLMSATCFDVCRSFDYIFDNENVCQQDVLKLATDCGAFYTYVSSGGMYLPGDKFPMPETNSTKGADSNKQRAHEELVLSEENRSKLSGCAFFRPQYIVGPYTNKRDYLDWFFDRLTRDLPVPIPAPGDQTTTVSDVRDVASMLASVVGKQDEILEAEKANAEVGAVFNCASDKPVSLREIVRACGAACGKSQEETDALIRLYDPALAKDAPSGGKFPFRATNFDVGVKKAQAVLGWESEFNDFEIVAQGYYEGYKALGLDVKNDKMDTSFDDYVLSKQAQGVAMLSYSGERAFGYGHKATALVVTNKGGGHGEIGFHLAMALAAKGLHVQMINDNGGKEILDKKPFSEYGQLLAAGVEVFFTDLSVPGNLMSATCFDVCRSFDYIFDNENVCQGDVLKLATDCGAFYTYVSSGGMYLPGDKFPMPETNATKGADKSKQRAHEQLVLRPDVRSKLSGCAFFRPQYIVGPYTNKRDYLDWFFDRLTRNLPIPLPAGGNQTTTVTDARDVASMLAAVVGKEAEILEAERANAEVGAVFNCASDRSLTLRQIVYACGAAVGKSKQECEALIRLYHPDAAKNAPSGGKFPFRTTNFDVGVKKAQTVLGWESAYSDFELVARGYYAGYKALGLDVKNDKMDTSFDEYILNRM